MVFTLKYEYKGNKIVVINENTQESLYVNDELQDKKTGIKTVSHLNGSLPSGEKINVSLIGGFYLKVELYIDGVLLEPIDIQNN